MLVRIAAILLSVLAMSGCATVTVDRAEGVAAAGKTYVAALKQVNDLALSTSIDFTANLLPDLPRTAAVLAEETDAIKKRVTLVGSANDYFDALAAYFSGLDALAKGDQSDAQAKALGQVADSLKAAPLGLTLSDAKEKAVTGLAAFVGKQIHAAIVEKALVRDADTVAKAIAIADQMLDEEIRWINERDKANRLKNYPANVQKPFVAGGALGADWKKAWSDDVRTTPLVAALTDAKKASAAMQKAWKDVLSGHFSLAEIQASLDEAKAGIAAATAVKTTK